MLPKPKNLLVVELNAFSDELLQIATEQYSLPALSHILRYPRISYKTPDRYNSGFLEPWVQWISIHTGLPAHQHQLKGKTALPSPSLRQCWETLTQHGISTGVWGALNATRGNSKDLSFFLPALATMSEKALPPTLNSFLSLARHHLLPFSFTKTGALFWKKFCFFKPFLKSKLMLPFLKATYFFLKNRKRFNHSPFLFQGYFEWLSTCLFIYYKRLHQPQCTFLFLDNLAYLQRHHWEKNAVPLSPEMQIGLQMLDKILALLLKAFPEEAIIIHNGLSGTASPTVHPFLPIGTLYSNFLIFPTHIHNYEFNDYIFHYFLPQQFPLKAYQDTLIFEEEETEEEEEEMDFND